MKRHAERVSWPYVGAARAQRRSWRSILPAMVLVVAVMTLLPQAAQASHPRGVLLGETAASPNDVWVQKHDLELTVTPTPTPTLAWSDEFDGPAGSTPDSSKWQMVTGGYGFGHNELQYYTARSSNVATDGQGNLAITARSESYSSGAYTRPYTSSKIETRGLFATTYGSIQARIKLPVGRGLWPALWAIGADIDQVGAPECGEIDMMENLGHDPYTVHANIHGPTMPATPGGYAPISTTTRSATSLADDFHVYGVNWSPGSIQITLDGVVYATYTPSSLSPGQKWVFDKPFYLILNLAVGGDWPGAPDATTSFPATMLVDWVRVYSSPTPTPTPTPTPAPTPTPTPALTPTATATPTPTPTPTPGGTVGPAFAAKNVTVKHDKTCRIYFRVDDSQSAQVTVRLAISTKSGDVKKRWSWGYDKNLNGWCWKTYTCRLKRGTYRITVTGKDLAGNRARSVGRAKLVVK